MAHRIFTTAFADVYPHYVAKAERKGRDPGDVDVVIRWLTGYDEVALSRALADRVTFEEFFERAPAMNPNASQITGSICGVRVEPIEGARHEVFLSDADARSRAVRLLDAWFAESF